MNMYKINIYCGYITNYKENSDCHIQRMSVFLAQISFIINKTRSMTRRLQKKVVSKINMYCNCTTTVHHA